MELLYKGFDGLEIAFNAQISEAFDTALAEAKEAASKAMEPHLLYFNDTPIHVAETGSRGGYAYRCDTGPDGATWFFKRPNRADGWGVRVSVKSLPLALYGLGGVRARLYAFLDALGIEARPGCESIGRVDYAVDVLAPDFILNGESFVMHSHANRADHFDAPPFVQHGKSGRLTSVTIGKMPGRQVIVYDKREEVVAKRKVEWWEIWNAGRTRQGQPLLDPGDRESSQVWRVELRAGKKHLKESWGITTWPQFDDQIGKLFLKALEAVRYTLPQADRNRSRWPLHPLWKLTENEVSDDLYEMIAEADPVLVKTVKRQAHYDMLISQITGLVASIGALTEVKSGQEAELVESIRREIVQTAARQPRHFARKMERAAARYAFINS
ncbi:hypothetical protein AAFN88_16890 [Pelagibius sp. CAU 1746]|uniref:hypothetical protein n=1 Tax=Pelagibius sp. CAU 1746 TaxID=3140370 RepID=UPI00325BA672